MFRLKQLYYTCASVVILIKRGLQSSIMERVFNCRFSTAAVWSAQCWIFLVWSGLIQSGLVWLNCQICPERVDDDKFCTHTEIIQQILCAGPKCSVNDNNSIIFTVHACDCGRHKHKTLNLDIQVELDFLFTWHLWNEVTTNMELSGFWSACCYIANMTTSTMVIFYC